MIYSDGLDMFTSTVFFAAGAAHGDPLVASLGVAGFYISYQSYRANVRALPVSCGARME